MDKYLSQEDCTVRRTVINDGIKFHQPDADDDDADERVRYVLQKYDFLIGMT